MLKKTMIFSLGTSISLLSYLSNGEAFPKIPKSTFLPKSSPMAAGGGATTPLGHIHFCSRYPTQCRVFSGKKAKRKGAVVLNQKTWAELVNVNNYVNRSIRSQTDWKTHGKVDVWSISNSIGDCEDYALSKRKALLSRGWPSSSLLITTAWDHLGRAHAILLAKTSAGDFVLDNLTSQVRAWKKVPYRWAKRQSQYNPRKWVKLSGYRAPGRNYKHLSSKAEARKELNRILRKIKRKQVKRSWKSAQRTNSSAKLHDTIFADH